jgi:hypothetical protein
MFLDQYLPSYDASDSIGCLVEADTETTWKALLATDVIDVVGGREIADRLAALRMLPRQASDLATGRSQRRHGMCLKDIAELPADEGGWALLEERPGRQLVLGLVAALWKPVIEFANVNRARFRDFNEPGFAKVVHSFSVEAIDDTTSYLVADMRTATTDERACNGFRRYSGVGLGSGSHVLVEGMLDAASARAERLSGAVAPLRALHTAAA